MKRILLATVFAVSAVAMVNTEALAQVNVNIVIGNPPPPVRYEVIPAPRSGYIWAPGYWNWNGSRHVWNGGQWQRARTGYYYTQPQWRQSGSEWRLDRGGWERGHGHDDKHDYKDEYKDEYKHKGEKHGKKHGDKHDDNHDDDHYDKHGGRGDGHCPPGQAKKGNC